MEKLYTVHKNKQQEQTVAQIMNSLLPNSDLNWRKQGKPLDHSGMTNPDNMLKSRDITLPTKVHIVKAVVFPVVICGWRRWSAEDLMLLNCGVGEDPWKISREIKPVHPTVNQPWIFIGGTDAEAEAPILWPPDAKNWVTEKDPDAGKEWRQEEKGMTEDEMVVWHHQLNGH